MIPRDLVLQAEHLVGLSKNKPKQANLRRAVSSSYYAVFHALCQSNANVVAGTGATRSERAWLQTYRALNHADAKNRCKDTRKKGFPAPIIEFAEAFVALQEYRHRADYNPDPAENFSKNEAALVVTLARSAVAAIGAANVKDRRAFALHLLLPYRG